MERKRAARSISPTRPRVRSPPLSNRHRQVILASRDPSGWRRTAGISGAGRCWGSNRLSPTSPFGTVRSPPPPSLFHDWERRTARRYRRQRRLAGAWRRRAALFRKRAADGRAPRSLTRVSRDGPPLAAPTLPTTARVQTPTSAQCSEFSSSVGRRGLRVRKTFVRRPRVSASTHDTVPDEELVTTQFYDADIEEESCSCRVCSCANIRV
ncbi:hypothetical protein MTO96_032939 [Rhipicephalus appendiculatus]